VRALWLLVSCVLAFAAPGTALAEGEASGGEDAQLLFDEGLDYMLKGELKVGCAFIKRSLDVDPRPGTIFTLAECYARAGKFASAVEFYDEYLNVYSRLPPEDQERQRARADLSHKERSKLVKSVPWITVTLPDDAPKGVVVTMDDEPFPDTLFGVAIAVDPGKHWFTARVPGGPLARTELTVEAGARLTHVIELVGNTGPEGGEDVTEPDDLDEPSPGTSSGPSPLVYVLGGVGLAGVATATVTGIMLVDLASGIHDHCKQDATNSYTCDSQEYVDDAKLAQNTLGPINTISIAVGAAGLGAAAILLLTGNDDGAKRSDTALSASASIAPGLAAFEVSGRF
jgi:hypothetical protein